MGRIGINISSGKLESAGNELVVGIDLGTTNSLVARVNSETGKSEVIGKKGEVIVPSVVHLTPEGFPVVGDLAKKALVSHPESTIFSVKRLLGRSYSDIAGYTDFLTYRILDERNEQLVRIEVNGKFYTPVELSSFILAELKQKAEQYTGKRISKAVITVPAYFNDSQRQATRDAGKLAGLDVLRIVNEPTAASLAYGIGLDPSDKRTILVYDLGGGTFDVSILTIENGIFDVLSTNGNTYLGGDDFDRSIALHWLGTHQISKTGLTAGQNQEIRLLAEKAKMHVCTEEMPFKMMWYLENTEFELELDIDTFNRLAMPVIEKTLQCARAAMFDAGLKPGQIHEIVLVGGSTRVPLVKQSLEQMFPGVRIDNSLNPDEVVALGAGIEADILAGNRRDILLLDVTPLSLGIETLGGLMDVIITRNSRIPVRAARQYTTSIDGQTNLMVTVFQGERELVSENRKLAEFVLTAIPAMPAGLPKIEISFMLDADGILKVSAQELRSGVKQEIEVKPQYGLTDEMVEQMLSESFSHAQTDIEIRLNIEARTEAEQLAYSAERYVEKNRNLLSDSEASKTLELVSNIRNLSKNTSRDEILGAMDALNEFTRPFAERLMDDAVSKALKGTII